MIKACVGVSAVTIGSVIVALFEWGQLALPGCDVQRKQRLDRCPVHAPTWETGFWQDCHTKRALEMEESEEDRQEISCESQV